MRFNVSVNEMASFGPFAADITESKAKSPLAAAEAQKEVCPRDEMANPQGTKVLAVERHRLR